MGYPRAKVQVYFSLLIAIVLHLASFGPGFTPAQAGASPAQAGDAPARRNFIPLVIGPVGPANGDFEKGRAAWTETSTHGWKLILKASELKMAPHGGSWAAWLGGDLNETATIGQLTMVSQIDPYLSYWRWIASDEPATCSNLARVIVNGTVMEQFALCSTTNTHGWVEQGLDLKAYAGKTVNLQFKVIVKGSKNGNLYLDDIKFQSRP